MLARLSIAWAVSISLLVSSARAEPIDKNFEHTFDVAPGAVLHLQHGDGDVVLDAWDQDRIQVEVRYFYDIKRWAIGDDERRFDMKFEQRGKNVYVAEEITGRSASIGFQARVRKEYSYTIKAPAYCVLDIEGEDGSVQISNMKSRLDLETDDGAVDLFQCNFERSQLSVEDGDVSVKSCRGDFEIECDDSEVDIEDSEIARLRIEVEDGDVDLDLLATAGVDWHIQSDDGDVQLDFAGGLSAEVRLETDEGDLRFDTLDMQDVERGRHSVSGRLGNGDGRIRIRTEDGDIRVRQLSRAG